MHSLYICAYFALHKGLFTEMGVNITGLHTDWAEQATAQGPQTPGGGFRDLHQYSKISADAGPAL